MAIRYNSSVNISGSRADLTPKQTVSLDSIRRNSKNQLNRSVKLSKKIFGNHAPPRLQPEISSSFEIWSFDDPDGNEVVDYTFIFSGGLVIDNFGDGTSGDAGSGVTITKSYS